MTLNISDFVRNCLHVFVNNDGDWTESPLNVTKINIFL